MHQPVKRVAAVALSLAAATALGGILGCDGGESAADRVVEQRIAEASVQAPVTAAISTAQKAVGEANASAGAKASAQAALAQLEFRQALLLMPELNSLESQASELISRADQAAIWIATNTAALEALSPADASRQAAADPIKTFEQNHSAFQAQADKLVKKIEETNAAIDAKQKQIAALEAKQKAALADYSALLQQSEKAQGQESVDLFKKAVAARTAAAGVANEVAAEQRELAQIQTDLASLRQQKEIALDAVKTTQLQIDTLKSGLGEQQALAQQMAGASRALLDGKEGLSQIIAQASQTLTQAGELRAQVLEQLSAAAEHYQQAGSQAAKMYSELQTRISDADASTPGYSAWKKLQQAQPAWTYHVAQGRVLGTRGGVYMNQKSLLDSAQAMSDRVKTVLQNAKLKAPAELSKLASNAEITQAQKQAMDDFQSAAEKFDNVLSASSDNIAKAEAIALDSGAQYSMYLLSGKDQYLAAAKQRAQELREGNFGLSMPSLPAELAGGSN